MKNVAAITILFRGEALQFYVSKSTTCDDVINMATRNKSSPSSKSFAIVDCSSGTEKVLSGRAKLLKHLRSLGVAEHKALLEIKEIDSDKAKGKKQSRAIMMLCHFRSLLKKPELKAGQSHQACLLNNLDVKTDSKETGSYEKNIIIPDEPTEVKEWTLFELQGKKELISRYLNDTIEHKFFFEFVCGENGVQNKTKGEATEINTRVIPTLQETTQDDKNDFTDHSKDKLVMDTAFIACKTELEHITYDTAEDLLNQCIIGTSDDTYSSDEDSAFEDTFDSICELERNVIDNSRESTTFNDTRDNTCRDFECISCNIDLNLARLAEDDPMELDFARLAEDDLMESFMENVLNSANVESDEGMGSVHSDFQ